MLLLSFFFFFNDTATTEIYTLSLHDALPISSEHRITVPRRTISDWISGYRSITTFHRLRNAAILQFRGGMLKERTLNHQQVYQYKVHLAKLALMGEAVPLDGAGKVKRYLVSRL